MGASAGTQCQGLSVVVFIAVPAMGSTIGSSAVSSEGSKEASSCNWPTALSTDAMVLTLSQLSTAVSVFAGDMTYALLQSEVRRGLFLLLLLILVLTWVTIRLSRGLAYRFSRRIISDLAKDEAVGELMAKLWLDWNIACQLDPDFKSTHNKLVWCKESADGFKRSFTGPLEDPVFHNGVANLLRGLLEASSLQETLQSQIREALSDKDIHRALISGHFAALKPDWMRKDEVSEPNSPDADPSKTSPLEVTPPAKDAGSRLKELFEGMRRTPWS